MDFIKHYSDNNLKKIIFKWNGKHGNDLIDKNNKFRISVCELLKEDFSISSDKLILDLYTELSKRAKETWSVYNSFHLFANEILERNPTKFFDVYFKGATKSMDTGMASGRLNLKSNTINEIVTHIKREMKTNKKDELKNYAYMLERFEYLKSKT